MSRSAADRVPVLAVREKSHEATGAAASDMEPDAGGQIFDRDPALLQRPVQQVERLALGENPQAVEDRSNTVGDGDTVTQADVALVWRLVQQSDIWNSRSTVGADEDVAALVGRVHLPTASRGRTGQNRSGHGHLDRAVTKPWCDPDPGDGESRTSYPLPFAGLESPSDLVGRVATPFSLAPGEKATLRSNQPRKSGVHSGRA